MRGFNPFCKRKCKSASHRDYEREFVCNFSLCETIVQWHLYYLGLLGDDVSKGSTKFVPAIPFPT